MTTSFLCPHVREGESEKAQMSLSLPLLLTLILWEPHLASFRPHYLPKAPFSNVNMLGVKTSTNFTKIQSITTNNGLKGKKADTGPILHRLQYLGEILSGSPNV